MRSMFLALAAAGGLVVAGLAPADAAGTRYPVCIQGDEYPGLSGCFFTSFQQCQATASGRFLSCIANPYYAGGGGGEPGVYRERRPPPGYPYSRY
jgi:Protein of unknown function (DUF3551)